MKHGGSKFLVSLAIVIVCGATIMSASAQRTSQDDWITLWINMEPDETDIHNPNIWMAGDSRYTGLAYDRWNDVIYIASPDMCLQGEVPVPCPKIHVWEAETGAVATRIVHSQALAPPGQLYVDPGVVWGGLRVKIDEGYLLFRIDLDDEGRIYAQNLSGRVHYPYLRYDPFHIYRWNTPQSSPELLAEAAVPVMLGTSLEVTGGRHTVNSQVYDSTRLYMSGGQQPAPWAYILEDIYVWLPDTRPNATTPFYLAQNLEHNEPGSFMAAHGIAATGPTPSAMLYMDSNSRDVILNHQQPLMSLNQAVNPDLTGDSGPIKFYLDTAVSIAYLICADGQPSTMDTGVANENTRARVVIVSAGTPFSWPATPTPPVGDSLLYNFWGPDNWVTDVDYKIWNNPETGYQHMQLFVLMSNNGIGCFRTRYPMYYPVEMETFTGTVESGAVRLRWQVAGESNNYGFEVFRSFNGADWEKLGFVEGRGTAASAREYRFDDPVTALHESMGRIRYRLKQVDFDGRFVWTNTIDVYIGAPGEFAVLHQNYPNPAGSGTGSPVTSIGYQLMQPSYITLKVYNSLGAEVATLAQGQKPAGLHTASFDCSAHPPGTYLYRLTADGRTLERKLVVTK